MWVIRRIQRQLWNLWANVKNDLLLQNWRGTLLLNLLVLYMESGDLGMNLRVPVTGMVPQWTMTIMVNRFRSACYKIQSYPTPPIHFQVAGEYTLEVPHPKFPELFVHPTIARFMCNTLFNNIHPPQNSDWSQIIYTLLLKRLGRDLQDPSSINGSYSKLSGEWLGGRTSTKVHSESTFLRPYQIPAGGITVGNCSWGIYGLFDRTDFQRDGGDTTVSADLFGAQ